MSQTSSTNIILVGFASVGKSAAGKTVAPQIGHTFRDLDDDVEAIHLAERGHPRHCRQIYSLLGRDCFVHYETRSLDALTGATSMVLATGGGTPIDKGNRARLAALGTVVYLRASPEIIFERMKSKGQPASLGSDSTLENLQHHWLERNQVYGDVARITIDTDSLTITQVADEVIRQWRSIQAE